jgi:hypothetical protein
MKMGDDIDKTESGSKSADSFETPIDFNTFILSLSSSAAFHLGLTPHPKSKTTCINLPMAKHTIDILVLLKEKTAGNLNQEEKRLLDEVLRNLTTAHISAQAKCK